MTVVLFVSVLVMVVLVYKLVLYSYVCDVHNQQEKGFFLVVELF